MADGEYVSVNGVRLFVRRFGNPALPMLIVVHGGPTWDHTYLLPAVSELADRAHVILFDLRGCGRSSRTLPVGDLPVAALQPDLLAEDVAGLIRHYRAAQADVLGFSYGGGIAMRVVDQHPDRVRRLILASTTAYQDYEQQRAASPDYQVRSAMCTQIAWDDPEIFISDVRPDLGPIEPADLIPEPGKITAKNARAKLAEQLAAAAALGDPAGFVDFGDWSREQPGELRAYMQRSLAIETPRRYQPSFSKLQEACRG